MFDIFLIFAQNIDCGYTLEPPRRGGSNEYPQSMFYSNNKKNRYIYFILSSEINVHINVYIKMDKSDIFTGELILKFSLVIDISRYF